MRYIFDNIFFKITIVILISQRTVESTIDVYIDLVRYSCERETFRPNAIRDYLVNSKRI